MDILKKAFPRNSAPLEPGTAVALQCAFPRAWDCALLPSVRSLLQPSAFFAVLRHRQAEVDAGLLIHFSLRETKTPTTSK